MATADVVSKAFQVGENDPHLKTLCQHDYVHLICYREETDGNKRVPRQ